MQTLEELRNQIDAVDAEIVKLYERRMALAEAVATTKREQGIALTDSGREAEVLRARREQVGTERWKNGAEALFRCLIHVSKDAQRPLLPALVRRENKPSAQGERRAAYQGTRGAYSEEALRNYFGDSSDALACPDFEAVFRAVWEGAARYGVVPVENSTTGSIAAVLDAFTNYPLRVVGETIVRVEHCLLAKPGTRAEELRYVASHEQGILQCKGYLAQHGEWKPQYMANTAIAAQFVAEQSGREWAAIASRHAAEEYGLEVLRADIHDRNDNHTRFWIIAREDGERGDKISVRFTVRHEGGALYRALTPFATRRLNLMRIESRPAQAAFEYRFFVDFEGNLEAEDVSRALLELETQCTSLHTLGNYPSAKAGKRNV